MGAMFRVVSLRDECEDARTFRLARFDRKPLAAFDPGAHLVVSVKDTASGLQATRSYSITSDAGDTAAYEITVRRAGSISSYFMDQVRAGRVLTVSDPVQGFAP
jgi:ferredoxin-NADP reductase